MSDAIERARQSVVSVLPVWPGRPPDPDEPEGSGVVLDDGRYVLTAAHVVGPADEIGVRDHEGTIQSAGLVAFDRASDLALLRLAEPLRAIELAGEVAPGDEVCAIGNAFGLGLSATCGTVSAVHRAGIGFNQVEDFIQTDAAINPGASGGALVDPDGALVGVISAIFTKQSDANIGMNFAVTLPLALRVFEDLRDDGRVAWLDPGLRLMPHPPPKQIGPAGARIVGVVEGGVGVEAGLQRDDILTRAGGRAIRREADLVAALARHRAPASIEVELIRNAETLTIALEFPTP